MNRDRIIRAAGIFPERFGQAGGGVADDNRIFDASYLRIKNITLSYTIPERITKAIKMQRIRIYGSATDPFSIDNFPQGWDPESYSNLSAYMVKTFTVGAQITF